MFTLQPELPVKRCLLQEVAIVQTIQSNSVLSFSLSLLSFQNRNQKKWASFFSKEKDVALDNTP